MSMSSLSAGMENPEISALKDALRSQHQVMQKLHLELEEERECAATAASEALSMILRLQREKAAEHMEASQYKRLAEEKLHHAEESLAMFEELVCRKELEIDSLQYQIQAYRHKLLSVGFPDLGTMDMVVFGSPLCGHGSQSDEIGANELGRRASLPIMKLQFSTPDTPAGLSERDFLPLGELTRGRFQEELKDETCVPWERGCRISEKRLEMPGQPQFEDFGSCWGRIEEMDQKLKELSNSKNREEIFKWISANKELCASIAAYYMSLKAESQPSSAFQFDKDASFSCSSSQAADTSVLDKCSTSYDINAIPSPRVLDVYEVPQCQKQVRKTVTSKEEIKLNKIHSLPADPIGCKFIKGDLNPVTDNFNSAAGDLKLSTQSDILDINKRLLKLENEREMVKQEEADKRTQEIKLLKEISGQLKSLQTQIRQLKAEKQSLPDNTLDSVIEAMLSFSI